MTHKRFRSLSVGLLNGGFGGLFWVFIGTVICYSTVVASLAEMESMWVPLDAFAPLAHSTGIAPFSNS